jgi:hypothetical protein
MGRSFDSERVVVTAIPFILLRDGYGILTIARWEVASGTLAQRATACGQALCLHL